MRSVSVLPQGKVTPQGRLASVAGLAPAKFQVAARARVTAPRAGMAAVGTSPVSVGQVVDATGAKVDAPVDVEVLDHAAAGSWNGQAAVRVRTPVASVSVRVSLGSSGFAQSFGGNYADRLRLFAVPECHAVALQAPTCAPVMLPTTKDFKTGVMTADVPGAAGLVSGAPQAVALSGARSRYAIPGTAAAGTGAGASAAAAAGVVVIAAAASSGSSGDYTADPMPVSGTWAAGVQSGSFTYNYPIPMAPSVGGAAPSLALTYDSGRVDGMTVASNTQSSWVGIGWDLNAGYVERKFHTCAFEGLAGTGDLCWGGMTYFLHFNGRSSELVPMLNGAAGVDYRLKDDPGWQVRHLTGATNDDAGQSGVDVGEYWEVRTPDGTRYVFGNGSTAWSTTSKTNSVWTVPVNGNNAGEPCYAGKFANQFCAQAWWWNLDLAVDPKGNVQSYKYVPEGNHYQQFGSTTVPYTRNGYLSAVEYGGG